MGRKVKSFIALAVVMVMLYYQQSFMAYGAYVGDGTEENEKVFLAGQDQDSDTERNEAGNETGSGDHTGEGTEDEGNSGEDEGTEEGGDKEDEDPEDHGTGGDEEEAPPEEEPVECFQTVIPAEDGANGYFVTKPEIVISHVSKRGITKYRFTDMNGQVTEGALTEYDEKANIEKERFQEGTNHLSVWMEDEEGNMLEEYQLEKDFLIDTIPPVIQIQTPMGLEAWYQKEVFVGITGEDGKSGSGTMQMICYQEGQLAGTCYQDKGGVIINAVSKGGNAVSVVVKAYDKAGNSSEYTFALYVDGAAPRIYIDGIEDYMITSKPVTVTCRAEEENLLLDAHVEILREDPEGKSSMLATGEWEENEEGIQTQNVLSEDGRYQIELEARDQSDQSSSVKAQVLIDSTDPVICSVDQLDGRYLQEFCWESPADEWIRDFTSYTYSISLDGKIYHIGEPVSREGGHTLEVRAVDAAGNEGVARADFVIDHTPPKVIFQGAQEGDSYEEEADLHISLKNKEDQIDEILVNGVRQAMNSRNQNYDYQLQEYKHYEVQVKASDKAGNQTVSRICFQVTEKENLFKKMTRSLADRFTGGTKTEEGDGTEQQPSLEETKSVGKIPVVIAALGILFAAVVAVVLVVYRKQQRKKNTQ